MSIEPDLTAESQEPIDSSKYIRTFQQDYAASSGKQPDTGSPAPIKEAPIVAASPVATTAQTAPAADSDREAVLARLKARAQQPAPPTDEVLFQEPVPTPPKQINRLAAAPVPSPIAPQEVMPQTPAEIVAPAQFHTYSSDFADHIDESHASTFSVLAAEKDAPRAPANSRPIPVQRKKNGLALIVVGILLLVVGTGALVAAYVYMSRSAAVPTVFTVPALIVPDAKVMLTGTGSTLLQAFAQQSAQPIPLNNVVITYINQATTTPQGVVEQPASGGAFITALNLPAPNILIRNTDPISTVGIVHAGTETRGFFILRVGSYERTFAGMLEWEGNMSHDLLPLYPHYPAPPAPATSSTTPFILPTTGEDLTAPASQFIDEVVSNHDVRALKDGAGHTIMLYGYADKQTLLIARDEAAFTLLLSRLITTGK